MNKVQRGFTLFEMLTVLSLISLSVVFVSATMMTEMEYRSVGNVVHRAKVLANAIDYGLSVGAISSTNNQPKELGNFKTQNVDKDYMPEIFQDSEIFGVSDDDFFSVRTTGFSVQVVFSLTGQEYQDYRFSGSAHTYDDNTDTMTFKVIPSVRSGIHAVNEMSLIINED